VEGEHARSRDRAAEAAHEGVAGRDRSPAVAHEDEDRGGVDAALHETRHALTQDGGLARARPPDQFEDARVEIRGAPLELVELDRPRVVAHIPLVTSSVRRRRT
jgi:hypothetical protein